MPELLSLSYMSGPSRLWSHEQRHVIYCIPIVRIVLMPDIPISSFPQAGLWVVDAHRRYRNSMFTSNIYISSFCTVIDTIFTVCGWVSLSALYSSRMVLDWIHLAAIQCWKRSEYESHVFQNIQKRIAINILV